jgi:HAD superfamily hydrolase (TIGR01484 family)
MRPLSELGAAEAQRLVGLVFDLDDTLLDHGRLGEAAYSSLFRARESGLRLLVATGRPAGWGEVLARQWPIDGAVTENGAVAITVGESGVQVHDAVSDSERAARRQRLERIVSEVRRAHPELRPSDDVAARISDYTFDIGERERVAPHVVAAVVRLARELGARTSASSVHLHLTLDADDKASGAVRLARALWGMDPTLTLLRFAFIGDSENDASCFAAFRTTIGVANLSGHPTVRPVHGTTGARGAGFAEAVLRLVELRGAVRLARTGASP